MPPAARIGGAGDAHESEGDRKRNKGQQKSIKVFVGITKIIAHAGGKKISNRINVTTWWVSQMNALLSFPRLLQCFTPFTGCGGCRTLPFAPWAGSAVGGGGGGGGTGPYVRGR